MCPTHSAQPALRMHGASTFVRFANAKGARALDRPVLLSRLHTHFALSPWSLLRRTDAPPAQPPHQLHTPRLRKSLSRGEYLDVPPARHIHPRHSAPEYESVRRPHGEA